MTRMSRAAANDQRISGVVIGLVADVEDPDEIGRVKVRLPWYASGYERWARVAQVYAGDGYGSTWVPEVDTEVLIAFAHGDMRWPYVLGALHSSVDPPPVSRSSSTDIKTLRTPAGSELSFDEGEGVIELKTPNGATIRLDEDGGSITLTAQSEIKLEAPSISLQADDEITINGGKVAIN